MREKYRALFKKVDRAPLLDIQQRKIGGLEVIYVATEHKDKPENYPVEQVQQVIRSTEGKTKLLMEYFSPELEETVLNHPVWGGWARSEAERYGITAFSSAMEDVAKAEDVNVLVMDHANSAMHDFYEIYLPRAAMFAGAGMVARGLSNNISRRKALGYMAAGSISAVGGLQSFLGDSLVEHGRTVNAKDSRREMIARGIRQYAQTHEDETLILLYPRTHRDAILYYSDNPHKPHPVKQEAYDLMAGITRETREYKFVNGIWTKINSTPIY